MFDRERIKTKQNLTSIWLMGLGVFLGLWDITGPMGLVPTPPPTEGLLSNQLFQM